MQNCLSGVCVISKLPKLASFKLALLSIISRSHLVSLSLIMLSHVILIQKYLRKFQEVGNKEYANT